MINPKKIRMLISSDCFLPRWDGVSRFLAETVPSLAEAFEVTIVCPNFGPAPRMHAKVVRFPVYTWAVGDIRVSQVDSEKIKQLVLESDIIFNQTLGPIGVTALQQAHRIGKPVISYIHSIDWELFSKSVRWGRNMVWYFTRWYEQFLYNRCSLLLVPSEEVNHIFENAGIRTRKVVAPLGVNVAKFRPPVNKERAKQDVGLDPHLFVIGFSGRIAREKDLSTLRSAFDKVSQSRRDIQLLIVGGGVPSEERKIAGPNVKMVGMVSNVVPYLQAMDVFVLPSLTETSSLATMEAMACEVPVISTPVGRIKEYVTHGSNGLLFPKGNANALAERIELILDDEKLRKKLALAARQTAQKNFRWVETTMQIKKAVAMVLRKKEDGPG